MTEPTQRNFHKYKIYERYDDFIELSQFAMRSGKLGLWSYELGTDLWFVDLSFQELFQWGDRELSDPYNYWKESLHPDDKTRVIEKADYAAQNGLDFHENYRILLPNESVKWVSGRGRYFYDNNGKPIRMDGVVVDIDDIEKAKEEAEHQKQISERANAAKASCLARVAHELSNPLNIIVGYTELMNTTLPSGKDKYRLAEIKNSSDRMIALVRDLKDFSQITNGTLYLNNSLVNVISILEALIGQHRIIASEKSMTFSLHSEDETMLVFADESRLTQILTNLISNAIKYGFKETPIRIKVQNESDLVKISITNKGKRIPDGVQEEVFEPFNRAGAEKTDIEGLGLGLNIVKELVALINGVVGFDSKPDGMTTFWVAIPIQEHQC